MRCHYVYDKEVGRVLIPECWPVVHSGDIADCTCHANQNLGFRVFERDRYNSELQKRNAIIKELESEVSRLHEELQRHVDLPSE